MLLPGKTVIHRDEDIETAFSGGEKVPVLFAGKTSFSRGHDPEPG